MNAEVVAGTITSKQDAMDYVTWTYFFRRLVMNPSYYHLEETSSEAINKFLSEVVTTALTELESSYCVEIEEVMSAYVCGDKGGNVSMCMCMAVVCDIAPPLPSRMITL